MANDYAAIQARIVTELYGRTDLASQITDAIGSAITFYQRHKFFFNEGIDTSITTVNGTANYAVPTGFQGDDSLKITYSGYPFPMEKRTWAEMEILRVNAAQALSVPTDWAYFADQIWLYPTPNGAYALTLSLTKNLGALVLSSDTNAWMVEGEELIRNRAKADVRINVLREAAAESERAGLVSAGEMFYSLGEKVAFHSLSAIGAAKMFSGRLVPTQF